jgi:hypothetical protein
LPSQVIGLIETNLAAMPINCDPLRATERSDRNYFHAGARTACTISAETLSIEFVDADIQQLQNELAAEFAQLLQRLQKRYRF